MCTVEYNDKNLFLFVTKWIDFPGVYDKCLIYMIIKYCEEYFRNYHIVSKNICVNYFSQNTAFFDVKENGCIILGPDLNQYIIKQRLCRICYSINIIQASENSLEFGLISSNILNKQKMKDDIQKYGIDRLFMGEIKHKIKLKNGDKIKWFFRCKDDNIHIWFESFDCLTNKTKDSPLFNILKRNRKWYLVLYITSGFVVGTRVLVITK